MAATCPIFCMKINVSRSLILIYLLAAMPELPVTVQAQEYTYETNSSAIAITGYIGANNVVTIPNTINGLPVTSIGVQAFEGSSLTDVTIPGSVIIIEDNAFIGCSGLTNITLGK